LYTCKLLLSTIVKLKTMIVKKEVPKDHFLYPGNYFLNLGGNGANESKKENPGLFSGRLMTYFFRQLT